MVPPDDDHQGRWSAEALDAPPQELRLCARTFGMGRFPQKARLDQTLNTATTVPSMETDGTEH